MEFQLNPASGVPIWRQLADQIREAVARGRLLPGEQLPSVRELARHLVVNPNTIARAYTELERESVLLTRPGMGVFVAQPRAELLEAVRQQRLADVVDRLLTEAVLLGLSREAVLAAVTRALDEYRWPEEVRHG